MGSEGDNVTVTLGDLTDPNLMPLAALYMNSLKGEGTDLTAPDELGLHNAKARNVTVVADHPMGKGNSYQLDNSGLTSRIEVPDNAVFQRTQNIGFRLDVKPKAHGGLLMNHSNGAHTLRYTNDGKFEYQVITEQGTYTVTTPDSYDLEQWHSIGARFHNGQLELQVNHQTPITTFVQGEIDYNSGTIIANSQTAITLGDDFDGLLNSFKVYDTTSQPLMTHPNGQQQQTANIGIE